MIFVPFMSFLFGVNRARRHDALLRRRRIPTMILRTRRLPNGFCRCSGCRRDIRQLRPGIGGARIRGDRLESTENLSHVRIERVVLRPRPLEMIRQCVHVVHVADEVVAPSRLRA